MTQLTLTYVNRTERTSKAGKPFTSLSIKAKEYGDRFLSGFGNKDNASWQVGSVVEVAEIKEIEKDGKKYLNFEMPRKEDAQAKQNEIIMNSLAKLHLKIDAIAAHVVPAAKAKIAGTDIDYPEPVDVGLDEDNLATF